MSGFIDELKKKRALLVKNILNDIFLENAVKIHIPDFAKAAYVFQTHVNALIHKNNYQYNPFDAGYFPHIRKNIAPTPLFTIIQKIPKGAILHLHASSMGNYQILLNLAKDYQGAQGELVWVFQNLSKIKNQQLFIVAQNKQDGYEQLNNVKPSKMQQILAKLIPNFNKVGRPLVSAQIWNIINPIFAYVYVLLRIPEIGYPFYDAAIKYLKENDHVRHIEIRSKWYADKINHYGSIENMIVTAVQKYGMTLKVIASTSRGSILQKPESRQEATQYFIKVGKEMQQNPNTYYAGIDFVGQEDVGYKTNFCYDIFNDVYKGLNNSLPPVILHDGESSLPFLNLIYDHNALSIVDYSNQNIIDAFLLNTLETNNFKQKPMRIGHGLELCKSAYLMDLYKKHYIGVEICPISNNYLGYVADLRNHPGIIYFTKGIKISLNPDDPAIFGYEGVSWDFWFAVVSWGLNLQDLVALTLNSLEISSLNYFEKITTKKVLIADWKKFCQWIINQ